MVRGSLNVCALEPLGPTLAFVSGLDIDEALIVSLENVVEQGGISVSPR